MAASIQIERLTKFYDGEKTPALDNLTLQVEPGEVYGFLGANGAGKSTTIRLLMNFLQPSGGTAKIMGLDIVESSVEAKKQIGYLSGDVALYTKPTGRQLLDYLGRLQGKADKEYRSSLEKRFQAELDKPLSDLSKGNRQKIGILQALMHRPNVLILDEPTSGLDPLMQEVFYDTLREAKQQGTAVFMSSHNLSEAQRICDRVGIIKHGKLIRQQSIGESTELGGTVFRVTFTNPSAIAELKKANGLKFLTQEGGNTALVEPSGSLSAALKALAQFDIRELTTQKLTLEDEFLEFYGENE